MKEFHLTSNHVLMLATVVAITLALIPLSLYVWWSRPRNSFILTDQIHVVEKEVSIGGSLEYKMSYCKYSDVSAETHYSFIDSVVYPLPGMVVRELELGCHQVVEGLIVPDVPPGSYRLDMLRVYNVTPFQRLEVHSLSNLFKVVKGMATSEDRMPQGK